MSIMPQWAWLCKMGGGVLTCRVWPWAWTAAGVAGRAVVASPSGVRQLWEDLLLAYRSWRSALGHPRL